VADSDGVYATRFTATGRRDLDKLPPRILAAVIEFAFVDLAREPRRVGKPRPPYREYFMDNGNYP
jgi:mRNA interferase RelE/StbE